MNSTTKQAETPIFFEVLATRKTSEAGFRNDIKGVNVEAMIQEAGR